MSDFTTTVYKAANHSGTRLGAFAAMLAEKRELDAKHHTAFLWSDMEGGYLLMAKPKGFIIDTHF
tara:strand:- start:15305 stop:15499 length:195 start_codon:yes stop_codon:yes gene_type:complete